VLDAHPLCVECQAEGRVTRATDVHHRQRHQGDPAIFWDCNGLEALCSAHHSAHTARGE
jgi:5-methylcytosine-specific restriction protein A